MEYSIPHFRPEWQKVGSLQLYPIKHSILNKCGWLVIVVSYIPCIISIISRYISFSSHYFPIQFPLISLSVTVLNGDSYIISFIIGEPTLHPSHIYVQVYQMYIKCISYNCTIISLNILNSVISKTSNLNVTTCQITFTLW